MSIVLFEDTQVSQLAPITTGRAAFNIGCGSYRLIDWVTALGEPVHAVVRSHLLEVQQLDAPELACGGTARNLRMVVNARLVPSRTVFRKLRRWLSGEQPAAIYHGDSLVAAVWPEGREVSVPLTSDDWAPFLVNLGVDQLPRVDDETPLFQLPHDVIRSHMQVLPENLQHRLETGAYREVAEGLFLAPGAQLGEHVATDTREGPIVLEADARVGPHCFLSGPAWVGPRARLIEHAAIKDGVALGHTTKIGGEVEASIIEPFSNKQHYGFLGHSYLGSWVNLGAGTCNSDLKNTYGKINMEYGGQKYATEMQFLGCIMGDYSKSAINTGIFTGKTIGVCSMLYGYVTTNVPSFVNYARLFGQVNEIPADVMVATQQRMFLRRKVTQRPCDAALIHAMYELTRQERQLAGDQLSL